MDCTVEIDRLQMGLLMGVQPDSGSTDPGAAVTWPDSNMTAGLQTILAGCMRMTTYILTGPLALDLLSVPASQAFVERIFSLCSLMTAGRRNQRNLEM